MSYVLYEMSYSCVSFLSSSYSDIALPGDESRRLKNLHSKMYHRYRKEAIAKGMGEDYTLINMGLKELHMELSYRLVIVLEYLSYRLIIVLEWVFIKTMSS